MAGRTSERRRTSRRRRRLRKSRMTSCGGLKLRDLQISPGPRFQLLKPALAQTGDRSPHDLVSSSRGCSGLLIGRIGKQLPLALELFEQPLVDVTAAVSNHG